MCFNVGGLRWVSTWRLEKNMFILPHILIATFCMYMNQITSNKYNEFHSSSMICSWMYLPWLSTSFVLEHMHSTHASITTTMWVAYICTLWKIISKNHIKIETWPKPNLKKMETMLYLFILIYFFESKTIISCHIFLLPCFTYMSNKLHLIKTLANPIHF